ncbi:hypothetical protein Y1Q_0022058 [Alligator mississippiensis]|uniref:Uncharacterized protein n=1 Tax=Alligator mississippiensis TaxID=8496 RepID=A0A151NM85_ALLMI|nr:hypothetical protein Y1Q_0022058 [Alligator mississippiensis]
MLGESHQPLVEIRLQGFPHHQLTLHMYHLHQHQILDYSMLLERLIMAVEQLADFQAWHCQDLKWDWERDQNDCILKEKHLTLLERIVVAQDHQSTMVHWVVEVTEKDCWVLDTIVALTLSFVLPDAQLGPHYSWGDLF